MVKVHVAADFQIDRFRWSGNMFINEKFLNKLSEGIVTTDQVKAVYLLLNSMILRKLECYKFEHSWFINFLSPKDKGKKQESGVPESWLEARKPKSRVQWVRGNCVLRFLKIYINSGRKGILVTWRNLSQSAPFYIILGRLMPWKCSKTVRVPE